LDLPLVLSRKLQIELISSIIFILVITDFGECDRIKHKVLWREI
jgi:hypothetical protein